MTLTAKPIIKNQYWVITDGEKKVGNVIADGSGFNVKINGVDTFYKDTMEIKKAARIEFQTVKTNKTKIQLPFATFPTTERVYNSVFDVRKKIHLYTKQAKSKCYHAAGYYVINQNGVKDVVFCPKYIFLQRYPYVGPYKTLDEAQKQINSL